MPMRFRHIPLFFGILLSLSLTACWITDNEEPTPKTEIAKFLTAQEGGETPDDPIDLVVNKKIPYGSIFIWWSERNEGEIIYYSTLIKLLNTLAFSKKYVNLDLSGCVIEEPILLLRGSETGMSYIVSLILPDDVTEIHMSINYMTDGEPVYASWNSTSEIYADDSGSARAVEKRQNFINMKSISGKNIHTIGKLVLERSKQLVDVDFPNTVSIGRQAFSSCTSLQNISFPLIPSIGSGAFTYCSNLVDIDLSSVQNIEKYAFSGNKSSDLTITMGSVAPTLGAGIFSILSDKNVTVRVPADASGYGDFTGDPPQIILSGSDQTPCWGNGFRGRGWKEDAFVNSNPDYNYENISLTIVKSTGVDE